MTPNQYAELKNARAAIPSVDDLADKTPRTLLYGYICGQGDKWHAYLGADGNIHALQYREGLLLSHTFGPSAAVTCAGDHLFNKRLCPESCDYEFCRLLKLAREPLPFTRFSEAFGERRLDDHDPQRRHFAGLVAEELEGCDATRVSALDIKERICSSGSASFDSLPTALALLEEAAEELGVPRRGSFGDCFVPQKNRETVLALAAAHYRRAEELGIAEPQAHELLAGLGVHDARLMEQNWHGGIFYTAFELNRTLGIEELRSFGLDVEPLYERALLVQQTTLTGPVRMVLADRGPGNGFAHVYHLLTHTFGTQERFMQQVAMHCR